MFVFRKEIRHQHVEANGLCPIVRVLEHPVIFMVLIGLVGQKMWEVEIIEFHQKKAIRIESQKWEN